ncbi:hypothetical protein BC938DRAFT_474838, partial [Jimgerdemannia flammicorona]
NSKLKLAPVFESENQPNHFKYLESPPPTTPPTKPNQTTVMPKPKICVTTCDGATGHSVVEYLVTHSDHKNNVESVCAMAIDPQACSDLGKFAKVVSANLENVDSMAEILKDCDTVYVIPPARGDKRKLTVNIIEAVKKANIKNILFLSTAGIDMADPQRHPRLREFVELESMLLKCACESNACPHHYAIIRASFYLQNLILYQEQAQKEGKLPIPIGPNGKMAPVNLDDVSRVASIILAQDGESGMSDMVVGQLIELTGPELLNGPQLAEKVSQAVGNNIQFSDISPSVSHARYLRSSFTRVIGHSKSNPSNVYNNNNNNREQAKKILTQRSDIDKSEMELLLELYDLTREGKLARLTTLAYKALIGEKPSNADTFFKNHAGYFKGGQ